MPFVMFFCTLIQEKGDEAQRIEMLAVSPSLILLCQFSLQEFRTARMRALGNN
jgi:hypothetical protein